MSGRAFALMLISILYWGLAILVLGGLAIGDCLGDQACMAAGDRALRTGLIVAVSLYAAIAGLMLFFRRGPR